MTPQRTTNGTLTDFLDRVLDKGLVIHADVIVSVAGIPLIGVNLRAALAGMETMLTYGMMQAWDEKTRLWENDHRKKDGLIAGEKVRFRMLGAVYLEEGIFAAWRYACFYLTDVRLLLYHQEFNRILFDVPLTRIRGLRLKDGIPIRNERVKDELCLLIEGGAMRRLTALDVHQLKMAIEKAMEAAGLDRQGPLSLPPVEEYTEGEETETCPQCGHRALIRKLLDGGCDACGWISPTGMGKMTGIAVTSASPKVV